MTIGWPWKEHEIKSSMDTTSKKAYLALFHEHYKSLGDHSAVADKQVVEDFDKLYKIWYGRGDYAVPIALVAIFVFVQSYFAANLIVTKPTESFGSTLNDVLGYTPAYTAVSAFTGAYLWVTSDFISRYTERNLTSGDVYRGALRLFISVAIGYALSSIVKESVAPFVAFCVGVFPLRTVQIILRRLGEKAIHVEGNRDEYRNPPMALSGMDPTSADRISDAGVASICQLAYCDPIHITMAASLPFAYVNDMSSQAIAWNYLGEKLNIIRPFGLRTAYEINDFVEQYRDGDEDNAAEAEELLAKVATATKLPKEGLWNAFPEIGDDPHTIFLRSTLPANKIGDEE
jgi:hypothetical protein